MKLPINFVLLKNPANWVIVILTIVIGGFALHVVAPNQNANS
jgi:hypothetical protein